MPLMRTKKSLAAANLGLYADVRGVDATHWKPEDWNEHGEFTGVPGTLGKGEMIASGWMPDDRPMSLQQLHAPYYEQQERIKQQARKSGGRGRGRGGEGRGQSRGSGGGSGPLNRNKKGPSGLFSYDDAE